jgi:hypothetical protein
LTLLLSDSTPHVTKGQGGSSAKAIRLAFCAEYDTMKTIAEFLF